MGATRSAAGVLKYLSVVNRKETGGKITVDRDTVVIPPRTSNQVWTGIGPSFPLISIGSHKIEGPRRSIIPQEVRNADTINASINRFPAEHRNPTPGWSKLIGSKKISNESADVYALVRMNFGSETFLSKSPNFINCGLSSVNKTNELGFVFVPTTIIVRPTHVSN